MKGLITESKVVKIPLQHVIKTTNNNEMGEKSLILRSLLHRAILPWRQNRFAIDGIYFNRMGINNNSVCTLSLPQYIGTPDLSLKPWLSFDLGGLKTGWMDGGAVPSSSVIQLLCIHNLSGNFSAKGNYRYKVIRDIRTHNIAHNITCM